MSNPSFFASSGPLFTGEIATKIGARLREGSSGQVPINTAAPIEAATEGALSFLENVKYAEHLGKTSASAVICNEENARLAADNLCVLIHAQPYHAYGQALRLLFPTAMRPQPITGESGISAAAHISDNVSFEKNVIVEAGCVIGAGANIGAGTHILAGAIIGKNVQIGRDCTICHHATIIHCFMGDSVIIHPGVRIGQDGFGFAMGHSGHEKIAQIGRVLIQDNVEIGANTTIDRGANRDTVIGEGCKIDNLVQIGHNVMMGRHCVIVGLVGISGSATLGDYVVVAGQAGIIGHVTIGNGAQIGGGSAVHRNIEPGEKVMGYPSIPADIWMRHAAQTQREARNWKNKKRNSQGK